MRRAMLVACFSLLLPEAAGASTWQRGAFMPPPRERSRLVKYPDARADWDKQLQHCLNDRDQSRRQRRDCRDQGMPERRNKSH